LIQIHGGSANECVQTNALQTGRARDLTRRLTSCGGPLLGASASQGWEVIHPIAAFSEARRTVPLGHFIRTRQTRPFSTGDKAALPAGKAVYSAASRRFRLSSSSV